MSQIGEILGEAKNLKDSIEQVIRQFPTISIIKDVQIHISDKENIKTLHELIDRYQELTNRLNEISQSFEMLIKEALKEDRKITICDSLDIPVDIKEFRNRVGWDFDIVDTKGYFRGFKLFDLSVIIIA